MIDYVRTVLVASSTITNVVGNNGVWLEEVAQAENPPYIILSLDSGEPFDTKNGASQLDIARFTVTCYSSVPYSRSGGAVGAYEMSSLVRTLLDFHSNATYFIRAQDTASNYSLSMGNQPLFMTEQEYLIEQRR